MLMDFKWVGACGAVPLDRHCIFDIMSGEGYRPANRN